MNRMKSGTKDESYLVNVRVDDQSTEKRRHYMCSSVSGVHNNVDVDIIQITHYTDCGHQIQMLKLHTRIASTRPCPETLKYNAR